MTKTIDVDALADLGLDAPHLEQLRTLLAGGAVADLPGRAAALVERFDEIDRGNDATPAALSALETLADSLGYVRAKASRAEHLTEPRRAGLAAMTAARSGQNAPRPSASAGDQVATHVETPGGQRLRNAGELAGELARRLGRLDHGTGTTRTVVASVIAKYPDDRRLTIDELNSSQRVAAALQPASLTAAGGPVRPGGGSVRHRGPRHRREAPQRRAGALRGRPGRRALPRADHPGRRERRRRRVECGH